MKRRTQSEIREVIAEHKADCHATVIFTEETIKALGMTFTPVETTVKGRSLRAFTPMSNVQHYKDGMAGAVCQVVQDTEPKRLAVLLNGTICHQSQSEETWYSPADLVDGKPRSVPQTKTIGELRPLDVFERNGRKYVRLNERWAMEQGGRLHTFDAYLADEVVTLLGAFTWSRT